MKAVLTHLAAAGVGAGVTAYAMSGKSVYQQVRDDAMGFVGHLFADPPKSMEQQQLEYIQQQLRR